MNDLISRQELLESIEKVSVKGNVLDDDWVYRFIQEFPSAERKKGRWLPCETFECDVCGFVLEDWIQGVLYRYCPNCGAWMGGEKDATD